MEVVLEVFRHAESKSKLSLCLEEVLGFPCRNSWQFLSVSETCQGFGQN